MSREISWSSLRRSAFVLGLAGATIALVTGAGGCVDGSECGDELIGAAEQCDGADLGEASCASRGFDLGSLGCNANCTFDVSGCFMLDADADGADIFAEQAAGSDPQVADTDSDGFLDGEEIAAGADPTTIASWPYASGRWPNRLPVAIADGLPPGAWSALGSPAIGSMMPNYIVTDQYGNQVELHQFYGYKVMLSVGAVWCPPCNLAAKSSPDIWEAHKGEGVMFLEILIEGYTQGVASTQTNATNWANKYGLQYPVGWGPDHLHPSSLPTYWFINSDMTIDAKQAGYGTDADLVTAISHLH